MTNILENLEQTVETFVLNEVQSVKNNVVTWWHGFEPIAEADALAFFNAMKPVAFALVTGLAEAALGGPAKFSLASNTLLAVAQSQGLTASKTLADTLIQQFVLSLGLAKPSK